jgi:DNA-binding GntR family transcriptional regulator
VLIEILNGIRDRIHIFRLLTARFPDRVKRASLEHRMVVAALREQDVERAELLMMEHIENTFRVGMEDESSSSK